MKEDKGWRSVRVFISSTFVDMQAERDHLVRFVFPRLREDLLQWRIHLSDVDLRWGVTSDQNSLEACKEIIDECTRFVCILGERYGWVPPGEDLSITAEEVRHALNTITGGFQHHFFYFRDPKATKGIPEEYYGGYKEQNPQRADKLDRLKREIADSGFVPRIYPAKWNHNLNRFVDLERFGDLVYEDLMWSIVDEFGEKKPDLMDEFAKENSAMETFSERHLERFGKDCEHFDLGSRQPIFDEMMDFAEKDGAPNIFVITGEPGSGKSALLSIFYQKYREENPNKLVIPHFIGAGFGSTDLSRMLQRLCHEISTVICDQQPFPGEDIKDLAERFAEILRESADRTRLVLIIDALNQLDDKNNAHGMAWIPHDLPADVRVIVSSLPHPALDSLHSRENGVRKRELEELDQEDELAIIERFNDRYKKTLDEGQLKALLSKNQSGNPLYLSVALEELRTLGDYNEITARINDLPGEVQPLFRWILKERLSKEPGFRDGDGKLIGMELVKKFVSYLAASRSGLSQAELFDLIQPGDTLGNISALQRLLRPYLMMRGELLDFYHEQLREVAEAEYLVEVDESLIHQELASYFKKTTLDRILDEYPYQLSRSKDWQTLASTMSNLNFFAYAWQKKRKYEWMSYWKELRAAEYDPNVWYIESKNLVERLRGGPLEDGQLLHQLGWFLMEMEMNDRGEGGDYGAALQLLGQALNVHERYLGSDHPSVAVILNGMALILSMQSKKREGLHLYDRVRAIREQQLGTHHPKVAAVFSNMGLLNYQLGDKDEALDLYKKALKIYELANDRSDPEAANVHNNLGLMCRERGEYDAALDHYLEALEIIDRWYEADSPARKSVIKNIDDVKYEMGMLTAAKRTEEGT